MRCQISTKDLKFPPIVEDGNAAFLLSYMLMYCWSAVGNIFFSKQLESYKQTNGLQALPEQVAWLIIS